MKRSRLNFAGIAALILCLMTVAFWILSYRRSAHVELIAGHSVCWLGGFRGRVDFHWRNHHIAGQRGFNYYLVTAEERSRESNTWFHWYFNPSSQVEITFPIGLLLVLPLFMLGLSQLCSREQREGSCVKCGYDLRATPDRCPECGTASTTLERGMAGESP